MSRCLGLVVAASVAFTGCLEGESIDQLDGECPPVSTKVLAVRAGLYGDTGGIDPPLVDGGMGPEDTDYQLEISEDRTRVIETYRRGGKLHRVEYRATVETRRR